VHALIRAGPRIPKLDVELCAQAHLLAILFTIAVTLLAGSQALFVHLLVHSCHSLPTDFGVRRQRRPGLSEQRGDDLGVKVGLLILDLNALPCAEVLISALRLGWLWIGCGEARKAGLAGDK